MEVYFNELAFFIDSQLSFFSRVCTLCNVPSIRYSIFDQQIVKRTNQKLCWVCFIEYLVHPTNKVYHDLTPQPRSFLRELPTLGAFWLFALHHPVSLASTVATGKFLLDVFLIENTQSVTSVPAVRFESLSTVRCCCF